MMRARFVPTYFERCLLDKMQRLNQGDKSVEDYYQELLVGMIRASVHEGDNEKIARFLGGLNKKIQDILHFQNYNSLDELFHYACKAERQVQGNRQVYSKSNRTYPSSSTPLKGTNQQQKSFSPSRGTTPAAKELSAGRSTSSVHKPTDPNKTVAVRTKSSSSVFSTARTREIECFKCKGKGHYMRDHPNQQALIIRDMVSIHQLVKQRKVNLIMSNLTTFLILAQRKSHLIQVILALSFVKFSVPKCRKLKEDNVTIYSNQNL
jgi:hypothetical protein